MTKNIYLISATLDDGIIYKIGHTRREVRKRLKELKTANPYELEIVKVFITDKYGSNIEKSLHRNFHQSKIDGEWFRLSEDDVDQFESLCEKYYEIFDDLQNENLYIQEKGIKFK